MGTAPYIQRLQRSVAGSAVTEAISETRSGFRPKKLANKKVYPITNSQLLYTSNSILFQVYGSIALAETSSNTPSSKSLQSIVKGKDRTVSKKRKVGDRSPEVSDIEEPSTRSGGEFKAGVIVVFPHGIEVGSPKAVPLLELTLMVTNAPGYRKCCDPKPKRYLLLDFGWSCSSRCLRAQAQMGCPTSLQISPLPPPSPIPVLLDDCSTPGKSTGLQLSHDNTTICRCYPNGETTHCCGGISSHWADDSYSLA